jgi:hypothetical protein
MHVVYEQHASFLHKKPILASLSSLIIEEAEIMVALTSIYF